MADEIANRIDTGLHSRFAHPLGYQIVRAMRMAGVAKARVILPRFCV